MSNEIEKHADDLGSQMEFARAVTASERGRQSILPDIYRDNPANVLIAVGLGSAMGLSPAESLYRIAVIKGKPSAGAELIAANVRKAGHKLRVKVTENPPKAVCTIIRADDPDEPTVIERDMEWAKRMNLANEPNYKKQPATMLSYRAITACARLACPEALYGVTYTPDEAASIEDDQPRQPRVSAADFGVQSQPAEDVHDAEVVEDAPAPMTDRTRKHMFALFNEQGITDRDEQVRGIAWVIKRQIGSRNELTEDEAQAVVMQLESRKAQQATDVPAEEPPADADEAGKAGQ